MFHVRDASNVDIDRLVEIAYHYLESHQRKSLFVKPRIDLESNEIINDAENEDELERGILDFSSAGKESRFSVPVGTGPRPIIAVDGGVASLGELADGSIAFAVRGTAVCYLPDTRPTILKYGTGALVLDRSNKPRVFHYLGHRLGDEAFYVYTYDEHPYLELKSSRADTANQAQDRCRSFLERMIHEEAMGILETYGGGILLIDGALPGGGGTRDVPESYLVDMLNKAAHGNIDVVAISKRTTIAVDGWPITNLFSDDPNFVGYLPLKRVLEEDEKARADRSGRRAEAVTAAEEIFAVRFGFGPPGLTFRVDVNSSTGRTPAEVLEDVCSHCQIYGGYPRPLIEADQYSSFLFPDIQNLLADLTIKLGVQPQARPSMGVLFHPVSGHRGK